MKKKFIALAVTLVMLVCCACAGGSDKIKVSFDSNYEGAPAAYVTTIVKDAKPDPYNPPARENFDFAGWYYNAECTGEAYAYTPLKADTTLYAKWTIKEDVFTVVFDLNYGSDKIYDTANVKKGETLTEPAAPTRNTYDFKGWFTAAAGGEAYTFSTPVTSGFTLYARWQKRTWNVSYDYNFEGGEVISRAVNEGDKADELQPVRLGYTFDKWYIDKECLTAYDFAAVTAAVTLYAGWIENAPPAQTWTVSFDPNYGGAAVVNVSVPDGTAVAAPKITREGYTLITWYNEPECLTPYNFALEVGGNFTLYADWEKDEESGIFHTVTVELGYDNKSYTVEVEDGDAMPVQPSPDRTNYLFAGWFTAAEGGEEYSFELPVTSPATIYAHWREVASPDTYFDVLFDLNYEGGGSIARQVKRNEKAVAPEVNRKGYRLTGWYLSAGVDKAFDFDTPVTGPLTLYAGWEKVQTFAVNFYDWDDTFIETVMADEGSACDIPAFFTGITEIKGWSKDISHVTGAMNVTPIYSEICDIDNFLFNLTDDGFEVYAARTLDSAYTPFPCTYKGMRVTAVRASGFSGSVLGRVTLPSTILRVGNKAFYNASISYLETRGVLSIGSMAFECEQADTILKRIVFGDGLKTIGNNAFKNRAGITNATLPDTVTKVGNEAFYGCAGLSEIDLSASLTSIGDSAFVGTVLTTVDLPSKLKSIGDYAFKKVPLNSLNLPDSLRTVGDYAFEGAELTGVSIGAGFEEIGEGAFYGLPVRGELDLSQLVYLGDYAFYATQVTSVRIGAKLDKIGNYAFENCAKLTSLGFESQGILTEIGWYAFQSAGLTTLRLPEGLASVGSSAFRANLALESVYIPSSLTKLGTDAPAGAGQGGWAFDGCLNLTSVEFGQNSRLTVIPRYSFMFADLTEIVIPASVETIGPSAFYGRVSTDGDKHQVEFLSGVQNVYFDGESNLKTIELAAFGNCQTLKRFNSDIDGTFNIPKSVTSIGDYAFFSAAMLDKLNFASGSALNEIGTGAFAGTRPGFIDSVISNRLTSVTLPKNLAGVGDRAFGHCDLLEEFKVETGSVYFEAVNGVLYNIQSGKRVLSVVPVKLQAENYVVPEGVTGIADRAFMNNATLKTLILPSTLERVGEYAFAQCEELTSVTFAKDNDGNTALTVIDKNAFTQCVKLTELTIPNSVTRIEQEAFYYCSSLASVTFDEGSRLQYIGPFAFAGFIVTDDDGNKTDFTLKLASFDLPDTVIEIGDGAFYYDTKLTDFHIGADSKLEIIGEEAFGLSGITSIYIPQKTAKIGKEAFWYCSQLKAVAFAANSSLTKFEMGLFQKSGLESIDIPASVTAIAPYCFAGSGLKSIVFPATVTLFDKMPEGSVAEFPYGGYMLKDCKDLISADLSQLAGITEMGLHFFSGCVKLSDVKLPPALKNAQTNSGNFMFNDCVSLTSVTLPASLEKISISMFVVNGDSELKSLLRSVNVLGSRTALIESTAFDSCAALEIINVPNDWYLTAPNWTAVAHKIVVVS